jgi:hypothetical protein
MQIMGMRLVKTIRDALKVKNYGLSPKLRDEVGVEITVQGLDGYDKDTAKSMRLDVLCGLRKVYGKSWDEFGKMLDAEFLPKPPKK